MDLTDDPRSDRTSKERGDAAIALAVMVRCLVEHRATPSKVSEPPGEQEGSPTAGEERLGCSKQLRKQGGWSNGLV